jgi:pilus assembly protein CpaE
MPALTVVILALDEEQRTILKMLVDGTAIARTTHAVPGYPVGSTDPIIRRIHEARPDVLLVDIPSHDPTPGLRAIELLHAELPAAAVFAVGEMAQPQVIVAAMRGGASEFLERPVGTNHLLEALARLTSAQRKTRTNGVRGRVFTVVNAKGGSGATTIAVQVAAALQGIQGGVALVDLAPLGHAALHLNVKPQFTVVDAIRNLHRLDGALLEGFMTRDDRGIHLLAGVQEPMTVEPSHSEFARLFDMLVSHYRTVVVDASSRLDAITRMVSDLSDTVLLVAHADVASLWSANKVQNFLNDGSGRERLRLVLNRYRKISGFTDADAEAATHTKLLWKIPNNYAAISNAIDRGVPVLQTNHSEVSRAFQGLATALTQGAAAKPKSWTPFR